MIVTAAPPPPPRPPAALEPVSASLTVGLTETEKGRVRDAAAAGGESMSAFGRRLIVGGLNA